MRTRSVWHRRGAGTDRRRLTSRGRAAERHLDQRGARAREASRRIHSSRSSSIADAGRMTQPQPASALLAHQHGAVQLDSVGVTGRCSSTPTTSAPRPARRGPWRAAGPRPGLPGSSPGSRAHRAPTPVPGSSLTTSTSTGPSSAVVPEHAVTVAWAAPPSSADHAEAADVPPGPERPGQQRREAAGALEVGDERGVRRLGRTPQRRHRTVVPARPAGARRGRRAAGSAGSRDRAWLHGGGGSREASRVPAQQHRRLALPAQHRQGRGVEAEVPPGLDRQARASGR